MQPSLESLVPPAAELKRVGPIPDVATYLRTGQHSVANLQKFAYLRPENSVLDIGCGYGRVAIHLTHLLAPESRYVGIDVVKAETDWCTANITPHYPNFAFRHLDARNGLYSPGAAEPARNLALPLPADELFDLVILFSVFTHMLPDDVSSYLTEIAACLKPTGVMFATFFLINPESSAAIAGGQTEFKFVAQPDGYYVHNKAVHEGALAYDESAVAAMIHKAGLRRDKVVFGSWSVRPRAEIGQDLVICSKAHWRAPSHASVAAQSN